MSMYQVKKIEAEMAILRGNLSSSPQKTFKVHTKYDKHTDGNTQSHIVKVRTSSFFGIFRRLEPTHLKHLHRQRLLKIQRSFSNAGKCRKNIEKRGVNYILRIERSNQVIKILQIFYFTHKKQKRCILKISNDIYLLLCPLSSD